jgi:hypothetical protein
MIKQINSLRPDTLVYELDEFVTEDEIIVIGKGIDSLLTEFEKVNLMICINVKRESFGAFVKEFQLGIKNWNTLNKIAFVADKKHWESLVKLDNFFTKFDEKYFDIDDMNAAWNWLNKEIE